ncbi:MAG: asparagine N-glycosylation enzyme membrane subunit Stt3 [Planctomycetota bacterium]|jgi:asparagine N-glycosylation enzyme membrane subunit Stt3
MTDAHLRSGLQRHPFALGLVLLFVASLSWWVRGVNDVRVTPTREEVSRGEAELPFTTDPDGLYHARRVRRALSEGSIAGHDPLLAAGSWPLEGAPIPWPPAYTWIASAWVADAPGVISDAATLEAELRADQALELALAELPRAFGTATSVLAALAAAVLVPVAAPGAALIAGVGHALTFAHLRYSTLGSTDHHALVSLLLMLLLLVSGAGLRSVSRTQAGASVIQPLMWGVIAGAVAALSIGVWVASLLFVACVQVAFGAFLWRNLDASIDTDARAIGDRKLAAFGLSFHASALFILTPMIASSPWLAIDAWQVVNLSLFHAAYFIVGSFVFVPLLCFEAGGRARARYARQCAFVALLFAVVWIGASAQAREAFGWAAASGSFMSTVAESQPLLGGSSVGWSELAKYLGWCVLLSPLAWVACLRSCWLRNTPAAWPMCVAAPVLLALAVMQRRFGDPWAGPGAVLIAIGVVGFAQRISLRRPSKKVLSALVSVGLVMVGAGHVATVRETVRRARYGTNIDTTERDFQRGMRESLRWLRAQAPAADASSGEDADPSATRIADGVLAQWDLGHSIEWVANRPTVATQFGSYVGEDSFLAPWRFFLESDEVAAEALMLEHGARYVLINARFNRNLASMVHAFPKRDPSNWLDGKLRWVDGVGASLLADMGMGLPRIDRDDHGPAFLRLVHLSPHWHQSQDPWSGAEVPTAAVFERVLGARVEFEGEAGQTFALRLGIRFPLARRELVWEERAVVLPTGRAQVRIPHSTARHSASSGEGPQEHEPWALGPATWSCGQRRGSFEITDQAVREGLVIRVE